MISLILPVFFSLTSISTPTDPWYTAEKNSRDASKAIHFCINYMNGWLAQADPISGLTPRRIDRDYFWNARDCAADNFPYLLLTAHMTGLHYASLATEEMLRTEQRLTNRVDSLPDTYDLKKQGFLTETPDMEEVVFGSSEYAKDGLMPVTEWLGEGPWLDRMKILVEDLWKNALYTTPQGMLPSENIEVLGNLMQVMSRLYWMTGDDTLKDRAYRIADYYLIHHPLIEEDRILLRDHGCEVIGGLSEVYVLAAHKNPEKHAAYKQPLHALLDRILEKALDENGMMQGVFHPKTGEKEGNLSDSWGYVYDAYYTVGAVDQHRPYTDACRHALENLYKYLGADWEHGSADGYADSVEGALNLTNRLGASPALEQWIDLSVDHILSKQQDSGISEGWYGDGNSARTLMMYALKKTQGVTACPWNSGIHLGSVVQEGELWVFLHADQDWHGRLRLDKPRHTDTFHMPFDYPRINQFPEWFTVKEAENYGVTLNEDPEKSYTGKELQALAFHLTAGETIRLRIRPSTPIAPLPVWPDQPWRSEAIPAPLPDAAALKSWQDSLRQKLISLLGLDTSIASMRDTPLAAESLSKRDDGDITYEEIKINTINNRRITALTAYSKKLSSTCQQPGYVCIHGHGGDRNTPFTETRYKQFGAALAQQGAFCIAVDVGRHTPQDATQTLMGERILDLMRCVDYLESLPNIDKTRLGCAGLSLGGEMAMWLAALDTRIKATAGMGFLTYMSQMELHHCMCWKVNGLRELVDYPDIYALIAPRGLQCQIGIQEPVDQFNPVLARQAFSEIKGVYDNLGAPQSAQLCVHPGGHEVDLDSLLLFFSGIWR